MYWLRWHLVVETSSLTVKKPTLTSWYYQLWMWRHGGTQLWSCSSPPTDHGKSHVSGSRIQNTLIAGHFSQLKMSGPLWSMWRKFWGHFNIRPCGCQRGIQSHCITLLQCTMTFSIIWTEWCELSLRRGLHSRKTCYLLWSLLDKSCSNTTLRCLQ